MKNIIDITVPLGPDTPIYPGDPLPELKLLSSISQGDALTASKLDVGAHIGTHVDLPAHFLKGGKVLGDYSIDAFVGPAIVLDLTDVERVLEPNRLAQEDIPDRRHILLKTRNSAHLSRAEFFNDYVHLSEAATKLLLQRQPLSLGIDYYSLDSVDSTTFPAHRRCAEHGIPVFVCLNLERVVPGRYSFAGLPVAFPALEGAPVRAILWEP